MSKTFSRRGSSVVVAIKFNDHAPTLIKWGLSIARRMGLPLVLVNVTEHHALYFVPYSLPILDTLVSSVEAENQLIAESQLENMAEKYLAGYEHKIYARSGYAAKEILEQAAYSRASLIIVGAAAASHHFVPKGFSTSLTLLAESPVPVLVISAAIETVMSSERCIVAFADDLSPQTESMARAALKFSASLGGVDFHHVHVNALTEEVLDAVMRDVNKEKYLPKPYSIQNTVCLLLSNS